MLRPAGRGLLVASAVALGVQALARPEPVVVVAILAVGGIVGLVAGLVRARRVREIAAADAAWALDRLGAAGGRGLVAATVSGAIGAEAAWAAPRVEPPSVRLRPPDGLAVLAGALLLATLALLVAFAPRGGGPTPGVLPTTGGARVPGSATGTGRPDPAADMEHRALTADAVRRALGLTSPTAEDPATVAERLRDPERRREALEAARGTPLEAAIADPTSAGEETARALALGREAGEEAQRLRRGDASVRAASGALSVPPGRRSLVERYLAQPWSPEPR